MSRYPFSLANDYRRDTKLILVGEEGYSDRSVVAELSGAWSPKQAKLLVEWLNSQPDTFWENQF